MTLKEAIDIGHAVGCITIGDVDDFIYELFSVMNVVTEEEMQEYWDDYATWACLYNEEFPNLKFVDLKI